jgi:Cd2+/Zn2+-exporting ATPase
MNDPSPSKVPQASPESACLARSVVDALTDEPALEAVTIDRSTRTISLATLGRTDAEKLSERITGRFQEADQATNRRACSLLAGEGDCASCGTPLSEVERRRVTIKHEGGTTTIARVTCPTAPTFWRWRNVPFPKMVQRDVEFLEHAEEHADEWKAQLIAAALCGVFGLTGYFLQKSGQPTFSVVSFVAAYLAGGWFPAEEVWERLHKRAIDVHFLMLAVAAGAASIGAWGEGAVLLFLFSLSGGLEHFALGRTQKEIRSLFRQAPKVAVTLDESGNEREIRVEQLRPGLKLRVKPGAQFPVDAEVFKGSTAADESNLTGEATPVEKNVGDTVLAGTMNLWGAVDATVLRPVAESALQKIVHLIREAQHQKAPSQQFTDKFGTIYTYLVLGSSLAMFFVWWLGFDLPAFTSTETMRSAFYRTMTLLVVASPCALVLSIPSAVLAAIAFGARHGVLIRGGAAVEKLAAVNVVALDKTGTLTTGELRVEKVDSFPPGGEEEIARLAYSLEKLSTHPLARAVTRYGKQQQLEPVEFEQFESITGQGLRAKLNGSEVLLGRRDWVLSLAPIRSRPTEERTAMAVTPSARDDPKFTGAGHSSRLADGSASPIEEERAGVRVDGRGEVPPTDAGASEVWLARDGLLGRLVLRDDVRPQARVVMDELKRGGVRTLVLTGDRKATADHLKAQLHLDEVRAELKPEEKVAVIKSLSDQGNRVAMVGDGVNDAPSLAVAHVGVAMGARGSDAALEQADVVLMHDRLENFLAAFRLSQRARRIIRQNLVVSLGTVAVLVAFALMGKIPLPVGVIGHEGSTVIVVMNSLRLLFGGSARN